MELKITSKNYPNRVNYDGRKYGRKIENFFKNLENYMNVRMHFLK